MAERDGFYVGYLPLPRAHRRVLMAALPLLLLMMLGSAWAVASRQRDPGDGFWQSGLASEWTGIVMMDPYPALLVESGPDIEPGSAVLLVGMGKVGAQSQTEGFIGNRVTVRARRLARGGGDGRTILELDPPHPDLGEAINAASNDQDPGVVRMAPSGVVETSTRELRGEILDSKCYLGAMKPGDGAAHRACATLCVRGGIPPMLFTDSGELFLLVGPDGGAVNDAVLDWIGHPVRLAGRIEIRHDQRRLRLDPSSIRPAQP